MIITKKKISSKFIIKIPKSVVCYFCVERSFLLVLGKLGSKLIKLGKVELLLKDRLIYLINESSVQKKLQRNKMGYQSQMVSVIKKAFLDVSRKSYKKLKLSGVGFRVNFIELNGLSLLKLDLGFSHSVYYKIPKDILISVTSPVKFIVSGNSSDRVSEVSSIIRKLKIPESYKGKGILYEDEEVVLKKIKKS